MRYLIIIEKCENSYSAYVADLPGCIAVGETLAEARASIAEAIAYHIEVLQEVGELVPSPSVRLPVENQSTHPKNEDNTEQKVSNSCNSIIEK